MGNFIRNFFGKPEDDPGDDSNAAPTTANTEAVPDTSPTNPVSPFENQRGSITTIPVRPAAMEGGTRQLEPEPVVTIQAQNGQLVFAQLSDPGMKRANNEDAAFALYTTSLSVDKRPDFGLFMVADGMGGHHNGEKASALAIRVVATEIMKQLYQPMLHDPEDDKDDRLPIAEVLELAVRAAHDQILKEFSSDTGTTLTAIVVMGNLAHIAHVGDSRAYLVTPGKMEQLTRDHSVVQRLVELGTITRDEARNHLERSKLYRTVGIKQDVEPDIATRRLVAGASVLLCSDGLWEFVEDNQIREIIATTPDPQTACEKLVAMANAGGGEDNITAVLFRMPGSVQ
jgi:protein phosphatase